MDDQIQEGWRTQFDARQRTQIKLSQLYAADFHHGADGHNNMMIIAQMAAALDEAEREIKALNDRLGDSDGAQS